MLKAEPNTDYIVYPSWAEGHFTFTWKDLPRLLSDPVRSGYLDPNETRFLETCPGRVRSLPFELIDGPLGGGIIAVHHSGTCNWLGHFVLNKDADDTLPFGTTYWPEQSHRVAEVSFLEMRGDAGLRFFGEGRKKPKQYLCAATLEHADSAAGRSKKPL